MYPDCPPTIPASLLCMASSTSGLPISCPAMLLAFAARIKLQPLRIDAHYRLPLGKICMAISGQPSVRPQIAVEVLIPDNHGPRSGCKRISLGIPYLAVSDKRNFLMISYQ